MYLHILYNGSGSGDYYRIYLEGDEIDSGHSFSVRKVFELITQTNGFEMCDLYDNLTDDQVERGLKAVYENDLKPTERYRL